MNKLKAIALIASLVWTGAAVEAAGPIILAHRGGGFEQEENTMAGFRSSYNRGLRAFETDIRMTKDGVLVVLHDDSLDRTHNATGPIEEKTAEELKEVTTKMGQKMLFLEELLDYLADKPGIYLELEMKVRNKSLYPDDAIQTYCEKLYQLAESKKPEGSKYVYTSFDERPLKAIRSLDADVPMAFIAGKPLTEEFIEKTISLGADHVACQLSGTSRTAVQLAQKRNLKVNVWPGRTEEDYLLARGLGVDVHCTDVPTTIISLQEKLDAE